MYIFLSSGERERYRNDILRNLSAPLGAEVTFRYRTKYVEEQLINGLTEPNQSKRGLVCHANVENEGPATIIPIRFVTVSRTLEPGSTLVLELRTEGFPQCKNISFDGDDMNLPRRENGVVKGEFVLQSGKTKDIGETKKIIAWEKIADKMYNKGSISENLFFVVSGIYDRKPDSIRKISRWPNSIFVNKDYNLYVYTYCTEPDKIKEEVKRYLNIS